MSRPNSEGTGSFTLSTSSPDAHVASAPTTMVAPWAAKSASWIPEPSPAPACTNTSWPCRTSSLTPTGVIATRYSCVFTSVGTAILMLGNRRFRLERNQAAEFPTMMPHAIGAEGGPCEILGIFDRDARRGHQREDGGRDPQEDGD